ncbi:MAG TPA: CHRD domain-containing protein [Devosia sp.]
MSLSLKTITTAAVALAFSVAPVWAEQIKFNADLTGAAEVPANDSAGTGKVEATLDTDTKGLSWTITYDGLTGPATAAHFHGPAKEGENAGPVVPIPNDMLTSPIAGQATLDDQQISDLEAGLWYFNVHTEKYPDGELRGQLMKSAM